MAHRIKRIAHPALAITVLALAGCTPARTPRVYVRDAATAGGTTLEAIAAAHPLPPGANISVVPLGRTDACSYHLVQVRDREAPHVHAAHDLAVTVLRGRGQLYIHGQAQPMEVGDVAVVPRGTPHYFVNTGQSPAAAFVTFAPPYDGKDQVPAE